MLTKESLSYPPCSCESAREHTVEICYVFSPNKPVLRPDTVQSGRQPCRNHRMLKSRIPVRRNICRQFWTNLQNISYICRQLYHLAKIACSYPNQLEFCIPVFRGFCKPSCRCLPVSSTGITSLVQRVLVGVVRYLELGKQTADNILNTGTSWIPGQFKLNNRRLCSHWQKSDSLREFSKSEQKNPFFIQGSIVPCILPTVKTKQSNK